MYNAFFRLARDYVCIAIVTCVDPSHSTHTLHLFVKLKTFSISFMLSGHFPQFVMTIMGPHRDLLILTDKALLVKGKDNLFQ